MLEFFESVLSWSCGLIVVIWISIGTLARSEKIERLSHNVMTLLCLLTAVCLVVFHFSGGVFWGSPPMANFLALVLVVMGLTSQIIPINGEEIQGEPNPHHLMKLRRERGEEE
ncbi:MAG: hypothetical protein QGH13_04085 [Candidatus Thalassarchaeaceae archaeon]|jgi:hypothetical protein|nr:hypothetical protein [Candidatus Thalassarchaeaceae archaeon]